MKIAVLADIHANLPAFQTVVAHIKRWQPDQVVVAGDIVNRGPRPRECMHLIQEQQASAGWWVLRGNHEDYVIRAAGSELSIDHPEFEIFRSAYWTYRQLGDISALQALPENIELTGPDGSRVHIYHASIHSNREGIFPKNSDHDIRHKIQPPDEPLPAVFCTAHTHYPLIRVIDGTLVVNVGSVGLPFDGDYRAGYAQIAWHKGQWQANMVRLDYDRAQTERDFFETGYHPDGGPLVDLILDELRIARPHLFQWTMQYHQAIVAGEMTIEEAVQAYLSERYPT